MTKSVAKVVVSEFSWMVRYLKIYSDEQTFPNTVMICYDFYYGSEPFSLAEATAHTVIRLSVGEVDDVLKFVYSLNGSHIVEQNSSW